MRRSDVDAVAPESLPAEVAPPWDASWTASRIIETLEPLVLEQRRERIRALVDQRVDSVTVLMDAPHDPHNGAAVLRSCDAFGVGQVHVVPRGERFLVSSRVSQGTDRWVDVVEHSDPASAVLCLKERGYVLCATRPDGEYAPEDLRRIARVALVLGNEHDGIRADLAKAADVSVRIPMRGMVESLNVSVAAAILVRAAVGDRSGDLDDAARERLYAVGLYRSVPRARDVLAARSY